MNSQITALRIGGTVFGLMCMAQLTRVIFFPRMEVIVSGYPMPLWPSVLAALFLAGMSIWMWKVSFPEKK